MKWPVHPIGEIFEVARGGSPRPIQDFLTDKDDGLNWIMIGDATRGSKYITKTKKRIKPEGLNKTRMVREGDFLLTNSMSFGHPYILKTSGCIHDGWLVLSPCERNISRDFFYYLLSSNMLYQEFSKRAAGAVVKNLNTDIVKSVKIPLPPLAEQERIAAILDKADAIRKKRHQAIALTEDFLHSAFLEMFGDPVTNPKGWEVATLGNVLSAIEGGWSAKGGDRPPEKGEKGVLKISAVTSGRFNPKQSKVVPIDNIEREVIYPRKGDLLFSRANTRELVAATCIVESDVDDVFLPDKLWRLVPVETKATVEYLKYVLSYERFKKTLTAVATGTSGSMLNISKEKLKLAKMPLPPLHLQKKFSALVWKSFAQRSRIETAKNNKDDLFNSLVQRAFRGTL